MNNRLNEQTNRGMEQMEARLSLIKRRRFDSFFRNDEAMVVKTSRIPTQNNSYTENERTL